MFRGFVMFAAKTYRHATRVRLNRNLALTSNRSQLNCKGALQVGLKYQTLGLTKLQINLNLRSDVLKERCLLRVIVMYFEVK